MLNPYFRNFNSGRQQAMIESLIIESIQKYGYDIKYLPRKIGNIDQIFGEDRTSSFENATTIEVYIKNVEGFEGEGRFMSQWGNMSRDTITFTMAQLRFKQVSTPKIAGERGFNIALENRPIYSPGQTFSIELEGPEVDLYKIESDKPLAGDLIFFPLVNKIFEIKYVDYEKVFYQTGMLHTYDLECEMFEYSEEVFDTPYQNINQLINEKSSNLRDTSVTLENNSHLLSENGGIVVLDYAGEESGNIVANNNVFQSGAVDIVDFSEKSPLVIGDKFSRW